MSKKEYIVKTVKGSHGGAERRARKFIEQGWEVVSDAGGFFMSTRTITLRKPNPKFKGSRG